MTTITVNDLGDHVCQHGVAMDVHCCNCHSGFIFDPEHECPDGGDDDEDETANDLGI